MLKPNIVEMWLAVLEDGGKSQAEGLREMNAAVGRSYGSNRVTEWRQGIKQPGRAAVRYMAEQVIADVLLRAGVSARVLSKLDLDGIVAALTLDPD